MDNLQMSFYDGNVISYCFDFTDTEGNQTTLSRTETALDVEEGGLLTLCDGFLKFLHNCGYDHIKDIKLGVENIDE